MKNLFVILACLWSCCVSAQTFVPAYNIPFLRLLAPATGGAAFNVSNITWFAWYDADAAYMSDYTSGSIDADERIAIWADKSGNSRHLYGPTPSTSSLQWRQVVQNSLPGAGSGASQWLDCSFLPSTLSQPFTVYLVINVNSTGSFVGWMDGTNATEAVNFAKINTDVPRLNAGSSVTDDAALSGSTSYILCAVVDDNNSEIWVNGTQVVTGDAGPNILTGLTIGNYDTHANGGHRNCETLIDDTKHDATTIGDVFGYLNDKFAVY